MYRGNAGSARRNRILSAFEAPLSNSIPTGAARATLSESSSDPRCLASSLAFERSAAIQTEGIDQDHDLRFALRLEF